LVKTRQIVVAIVEDDPDTRASIASLVAESGYGTELYDSAEAILNAVATSKASCLIVGIHLEDITGVELSRQLAADGFKYPIIFTTRLGDERILGQATAVGGIAFLGKPFQKESLINAIKKAVGSPERLR
jgi:two-component system, LuxR family, response regulator FixJ